MRERTEEQRAKARETSRIWRENNRERHRASAREYERQHRAKCECGAEIKRTSKLCNACRGKERRGPQANNWKGGRITDTHGYVRVWAPEEASADKRGYCLEHRLAMAQALGRELLPGENVHHINGVRDDNRIENLELWISSQPSGQRVEDVLAWAREIVDRYEP